jgi:7-cyano-7-deazaguanine reductase
MVEHKSLKLFFGSFRNHGAFHESCVNLIADRLYDVARPRYLRVIGYFAVRGGITLNVMAERGDVTIYGSYSIPANPAA